MPVPQPPVGRRSAVDGGGQELEVGMAKAGAPTGRRQVIAPKGAQRYARRDAKGEFTTDQVKTGRSIARDRLTKAKHTAPKGMKDRGD